jgi:nucleoside-diphosphate kinase
MKKWFAALGLILTVVGFTSIEAKENILNSKYQQTLAIVKPDAVAAKKSGPIIADIEGNGLRVVAMKMTWLSKDQAAIFYSVHKERPFYRSLVEFMSSGPIVAMVLEGENAVESYRKLMGATDPAKASGGTLRKQFGTSIDHNAVHGSDSAENAKKEIAFFFSEGQIYSVNK